MKPIINPLTRRELDGKAEQYVRDLRTVRRNARKDARSGNPARRAQGLAAREKAASLIRQTYIEAARSGQ